MAPIEDPITAPTPPEVPLPRAPLVRVLVQLRFPEVLSVEDARFVAPFQEAIRGAYPVGGFEAMQGFSLGPAGLVPSKSTGIWRFASGADAAWRVSLGPAFLALETGQYTSRDDLLERLAVVMRALGEHVRPAHIDRVGIRYIDQLRGPILEDLPTLVRPEVRGVAASPGARHAIVSVTESHFLSDEAGVLTRWGALAPETTFDPNVLPPLDGPSWVLDIDAFRGGPLDFDVEALGARVRSLAERSYTVFRWAVTDEFLRRHGGEVA